MRNIEWKTDCSGVDFDIVSKILKSHGLSDLSAGVQKTVFERSWSVVFPYDGDRLIGCGRTLSDGICHASIYNIAVDGDYMGIGLGKEIVERLLDSVKGCTVTLYTHPKTVKFYERLGGWYRQKTSFVNYNGGAGEERMKWLRETGFLLPEGYRFPDDESEQYK